jgi:hypothetical protein
MQTRESSQASPDGTQITAEQFRVRQRRNTTGRKASQTIRENLDDQLRDYFKDFLDPSHGATQEERWFLFDVFLRWDSAHRCSKPEEVGIASAFEACIHNRGYYLCIPDEEFADKIVALAQKLSKDGRYFKPEAGGWQLWKRGQTAS